MRDLNDLTYFAAVVAHGGFSAAARVMGVPKSRVSRRVAALEKRLGVRLIERSTRRFSVTAVGREVQAHALAALDQADAVEAAAARVTAEPRGLVRIGCPLGVERLLAERLPELMRRYPRLRVQVMVGNRRLDLIEERIDVALRVRETLDGDADVVIRQLARGHACLVASPALLDERDPPSIPAELATWPTISQSEQSGYHRRRPQGQRGSRAASGGDRVRHSATSGDRWPRRRLPGPLCLPCGAG
ncbi:LysR family transcriptional regulator [Salinisphaera sp. Q1T1-3]|nr:LysR family transcriptional regulator [Salinisphaera sp. Q1T1-3]RJS93678.1 LysR family transcriptional regulator [Salinisphaera sp. Q1T1-3]